MKYLIPILLFFLPVLAVGNVRDTVPSGVPQLFGGKYYKFNGYTLTDSIIMNAPGDTLNFPLYPGLKFRSIDNRWYGHDRRRWQKLLYASDTTLFLATKYDLSQITLDTTTVKQIANRRTGISPGGYAGASVIVDTAGKLHYGDPVKNNLVDFNGVSDTLAFGRPAAHFNRNLSQALTIASNPTLQGGEHSMTWVAWVKIDTVGVLPQIILSKDDNRTKRGSEYLLGYYPAFSGWVWQIEECCHLSPNDGNTWSVISHTGVPNANQWYFIAAQYDHVAGKVKIWVNMVEDSTTGVPNLSNVTNTPFAVGAVVDDGDTTGLPECCSYFNGTIKSVGYWSRVLDSAEIATLYNNTALQLPPPGLNPGLMQNGPTFVSDVPTALSDYIYSVNFDGNNDVTAMSSGVTFNAGGNSISLWFKAQTLDGMVLGNSSDANGYIRVLNATTIRVQTNTVGTFKDYTVPTMSTGVWYNLIITRGGSNLTHVFLNGTESSSGGQSQTDGLTLDEVGRYWDGSVPGLNFEGRISDLRIYHSLLSGTDITNIQTNVATSAVPFLWYKLNEGIGVVNYDYGTAPVPHPLEYSQLPNSFKFESPNTFVSYYDLSEPYGTRLDARLRNVIRDSAVTNIWVDLNTQPQYIYGSTAANGSLYLRPTTNSEPVTGSAIRMLVNSSNYRAITAFNSGKVSIGDSIETDNLSILAPTTSNAVSLGLRRNDGLLLSGIATDVSANATFINAGSLNIITQNSNPISLTPATGVTIGPARSTNYKLDVLDDRTGLNDSTRVVYATMTNSSFNTISRIIRASAIAGVANGSRAAGSNDLINVGVYGEALNGQQNYAGYFNGKIVVKTHDIAANSDTAIVWNRTLGTYEVAKIGAYKVYTALLSQSGTSAPVATELQNQIGAIIWSYISTGQYNATLMGAFPVGKTWIMFQPLNDGSLPTGTHFLRASSDVCRLAVVNSAGAATDDALTEYSVEIRVYP